MITLLVQATEKAKKFADETTRNAQNFATAAKKEVTETLRKIPETDLSKTGESILKTVRGFSFASPLEIKRLEARISKLEARLDDALSPISINDGDEEEEEDLKKAKSPSDSKSDLNKEDKPEKVLKTGNAPAKKAKKKPSSRENMLN